MASPPPSSSPPPPPSSAGKPEAELTLHTPIEALGAKGKRFAPAMRGLGVANVGQLLAHLPMRHEFIEAEQAIEDLVPDTLVTARGEITATRYVPTGRMPRFEAVLMDHSGRLDLVWFNAPYMRGRLHPGTRVRVHGKAKRFKSGLQIVNPGMETLRDDDAEPAAREARLRPVYPASSEVTSKQIEEIVEPILDRAAALIEEQYPPEFLAERNFPSLPDAYRLMHRPRTEDDVKAARRRLAYDELFLLQLGVQMKRAHLRKTLRSPPLRWSEEVDRHIRERLPFTLTKAQDGVVKDVVADLSSEVPTNRLIQGDVGSGKTVVALYAMLMAAASKQQACLMAPTELLAEQHFWSICKTLAGSNVRLALLTGGVPEGERADILSRLERGRIDILVGTHAVLTESVRFRSLAVAIIDEQHRFGVFQRAGLRTKATGTAPSMRSLVDPGEGGRLIEEVRTEPDEGAVLQLPEGVELTPHVLVMTATPIPRTLALTLFGDLDTSTIRGLPPGRKPVKTRVVGPEQAVEVYGWVRERVSTGDQAYVVVPAIDTGDEDLVDLRKLQQRLEEHDLKGLRVAAVHGRLSAQTRDHVMQRFRAGQVDVLVATTVIEVGVDVPNATVMVIEHAERFGLAQLHQLRGRVGRGEKPSVCVLIGEATTEEAAARLKVIEGTPDGFKLAEKDLEIRGPGEVFGTKQSGMPPFRVADLLRDADLLALARRDAVSWIERSPTLGSPQDRVLRRRLHKAHGKWLGIGDVG